MFRQSLRLARKRNFGLRQLSVPPTPITLLRPYSDNQTIRDSRSPNDPAQTLSQAGSISAVIKEDHRQIEKYHDKIVNSKDHDTQRRYQNAFVWELTRHAIAEELVVYPSIETGLNNGKEIADKDREEHQVTKEQLYKFQNLTPNDSNFIPTLESLMTDLKIHIKQEEERDLVKLEEALRPTRSRDLAQQFEMTKIFTPTRSHPSAPNKPPYETIAGLMTAPLDKLGDIFRAWPDEPGPRPASGGAGR